MGVSRKVPFILVDRQNIVENGKSGETLNPQTERTKPELATPAPELHLGIKIGKWRFLDTELTYHIYITIESHVVNVLTSKYLTTSKIPLNPPFAKGEGGLE